MDSKTKKTLHCRS